jgi:hypothetical protein
MKRQNKREQLTRVNTCYYYRQQDIIIIIARTIYYYNQNNFVCHPEQKKVSEQMRITVRKRSYYSRTILCVISNKNKCSVRTSCYYSPNKILIARTTYYSSENDKNINKRKNIKKERI